MSKVDSTTPTSRRMYLSQDELAQFADITVTDSTEADDQISQAEELIDAYVGFHKKFLKAHLGEPLVDLASAGGSSTITLISTDVNKYEIDFFKYSQVEIVAGTGAGQRRSVSSSTKAGVLTVSTAWTTAPDSTSYYKIEQLGKFPRLKDSYLDTKVTNNKWLKWIPEEIKRAVAAQVEFIIEMGEEYFSGDATDKLSETLDDYSYTKGKVDIKKFVSPKARQLLRGFVNRTGQFSDVPSFE